MTCETAKKLKDAGFPQKYEPICEHQQEMAKKGEYWGGVESMVHMRTCDKHGACVPTLEELIEACGDKFHGLWNGGTKGRWDSWSADSWMGDTKNIEEYGSTPSEAVANLWLALNQ